MTDKLPLKDDEYAVVVGYDGTPGADVALGWAIQAAAQGDLPLTIVHTFDLSAAKQVRSLDHSLFTDSYRKASHEILEPAAERAREVLGAGQVSKFGAIGSPSAELVDVARNAELLVVGNRGRGRFMRGLLGSTAYATAAHATCPVVVVRATVADTVPPAPGPDHRVVVGVDGSDRATRALDTAARVAARTGAPLTIIEAVQVPSAELFVFAGAPVLAADHGVEMRTIAAEELEAAVQRVRAAHPDLQVEPLLAETSATEALVGASAGAGLLVVGSRGHGGFAGMLLGSVSHAVIHRAECPVMITR